MEMDDRQLEQFLRMQMAQAAALARIAGALEAIAMSKAPAPNFARDIAEYPAFDFTAIGATETARDQNGATEVSWGGYKWTRRSPQNKFGEAIWFSRPVGKDGETVKYIRLITFKKSSEAEPLPAKVSAQLAPPPAKPEQPPAISAPVAQPAALPAEPPASPSAAIPVEPEPENPKPASQRRVSQSMPPGLKQAAIRTSAWSNAARSLAGRVPFFQDARGQPDFVGMSKAIVRCGYSLIDDENLVAVLRVLEQYAGRQGQPDPA